MCVCVCVCIYICIFAPVAIGMEMKCLYYDQQMHNYFTNYRTPTCFDTVVSSSGNF